MSEITILLPRYLLPVRPRGDVLSDHAVVIEGQRIAAVLERSKADESYPGARKIRLPEHVLTPGFINMHTHSAMSLLRGYADDLPLDTWLNEHIWPAERRWLSREFVGDGTELACAEMIRSGTTCFNDMYFFPDVIADCAERIGIRACVGMPIIDLATAWAEGFEECFAQALEIQQRYSDHELIRTAFAPHASYTVTNDMLAKVAEYSAALEVPVHMHLLEIAWEIRHSMMEHGVRPLRRLRDLGLLNPRLIAVHMAHLTEDDINSLSESGVNVVHCPESNLKLASGMCPVAELLNNGVNLAVGTDGAASNNNLDLLGELRMAALLAKGISGDPCAVDAVTAIELVTINAAKALGMSQDLGSIEPGKFADLCAVDLNWPETQPVHHHVASQLVYSAGHRQVTDVWVAGRRILNGGRLVSLDLDEVLVKARRWNERMAVH